MPRFGVCRGRSVEKESGLWSRFGLAKFRKCGGGAIERCLWGFEKLRDIFYV